MMVRVLINVVIMQCSQHFHYTDTHFSSIQLLVNNKFCHQSSFKLIKTSFIGPASIYATLCIKVGGKSEGSPEEALDSARTIRAGYSPRPLFRTSNAWGKTCFILLIVIVMVT